MEPFSIFGIEIHGSHACNLSCESCGHFSNHRMSGNLSPKNADAWMKAWNKRVKPKRFSVVGGEPTINPALCELLLVVRENWPDSKIHLVTNGFFLHRHAKLPEIMAQIQPSRLVLSKHHQSASYMEQYNKFVKLITDWHNNYGIEIEFQQGIHHWSKRYFGFGNSLKPFADGNYHASFSNCKMKNNCKNLLDYKLFKCPPLAYINLVGEKYRLSTKWDFYRAYQPLEPDCTENDLRDWLSQEAIPECAMCPTKTHWLTNIPNPMQPPNQLRQDLMQL